VGYPGGYVAAAGSSSPGTSRSQLRAGSDHRGGFTKRYLHRLVTHHRGCLSVISGRYATLITLRTGWGIRRSFSRSAVARMLHISLGREGQLEHQAVTAIGTAESRGSCARAQRVNATALFLAPTEQSLLRQPLPRGLVSARASNRTHARPKHRRHHQAVSAASTGGIPADIPGVPHPGSSSFPWLFVVLGLVAATALASPVARRKLTRPRLAGGPGGHSWGEGGAAAAGGAGAAAAASRSETPVRPPEAGAYGSEAALEATAAAGLGAAGVAGVAAHRDDKAEDDPATALALGSRLERRGDIEGALAAYRRADAGGNAAGATNLGALLEQQGDVEAALAAYRRADARGDANGSFNLGCLLAERGDVPGAIDALRRADERGDAAGASNLGVLLEQAGDLEGALAAYRRADQRGDANGSFNLGLLLAGRGEFDDAQEAYSRATRRGDPAVVERAKAALDELRDNGRR